MELANASEWEKTHFQNFWAEIAPREHVVQVYETEKVFMNTLEGYVASGLMAQETVLIIATGEHIQELTERLKNQSIDTKKLIEQNKLILLDARDTLAKFMVKGWPDEQLFFHTVNALFEKANVSKSRLRAFGEMVALLWADGNYGATVHLEHLWNKFCATQDFCLYCAYPKTGFTSDPVESIKQICCTHSKVIAGYSTPTTEVHYSQPAR